MSALPIENIPEDGILLEKTIRISDRSDGRRSIACARLQSFEGRKPVFVVETSESRDRHDIKRNFPELAGVVDLIDCDEDGTPPKVEIRLQEALLKGDLDAATTLCRIADKYDLLSLSLKLNDAKEKVEKEVAQRKPDVEKDIFDELDAASDHVHSIVYGIEMPMAKSYRDPECFRQLVHEFAMGRRAKTSTEMACFAHFTPILQTAIDKAKRRLADAETEARRTVLAVDPLVERFVDGLRPCWKSQANEAIAVLSGRTVVR